MCSILKLGLKRSTLHSAVDAQKEAKIFLFQCQFQLFATISGSWFDCQEGCEAPSLKLEHIHARLQFMKTYAEWTEDDCAQVVISDESKINRLNSDGIRYVWDDGPGKLNGWTVQGTVKFGGGGVIVWSCMSWHGVGYIVQIDETIDSDLNIRILDEDLNLSMDEWDIAKEELVFQHGNEPKHTSKKTRTYLRKHHLTEEEGTILSWPAQSPDMNPREHLRGNLKRRLGLCPHPPSMCQGLWERIAHEWYSIPVELCSS